MKWIMSVGSGDFCYEKDGDDGDDQGGEWRHVFGWPKLCVKRGSSD